jgi:hypothetical protein
MSEERVRDPRAPEGRAAYVPPAIAWEEELPQGASLVAACGKIGGAGGPCNSSPGS